MELYRRRLARRIRYFRNLRKMSQLRLAEEAGLDRSYMSEIERGLANPSLSVIVDIATALETTPGMLLRQEEPEGSQGATSQK